MSPLVSPPRRSSVHQCGRAADFASVDVKGAIAIVRARSAFWKRLRMQPAAGAVGLNSSTPNQATYPARGGEVKIPVLACR